MKTLIRGGGLAVSQRPDLLDGGEILVEAGVIAEVGASGSFAPDAADKIIDATGCLVVPGLVNTHQHDWYLLGKGLGGDMILEQWIRDCLFPLKANLSIDDLRVASELACLDMIRGGTTTSVNHLVVTTTQDEEDAILTPVADSGMRQYFAKAVRPEDVESGYAAARATYERWHGKANGRIEIGFVLEATSHWVAAGTSTEEMVIGGHALATELDTFVSSHIAGGSLSLQDGYLKFVKEMGRTDLEFLHRIGVLDDRWILAHTIHPMGNDLDLIAAAGSTVSHTPSSEAARGGGIAPVRDMVRNGINVALGTDGPMVDLSNDMIEQLKWTRLLQNQVHGVPASIDLERLVSMGTSNGARAVRAQDRFGQIAAGMRADLAAFDLATLHSSVVHRPLSSLIHSARGLDAKHVMVDGELLLEDHRFTRVDELRVAEVLAQAGERGRELARRSGLASV